MCWATHKYRIGQENNEVDRVGSSGRVDFFACAAKPTFLKVATEAEKLRRTLEFKAKYYNSRDPCLGKESVISIAKVYHTTMWFEGTYLRDGERSPSSRLLFAYFEPYVCSLREIAREHWHRMRTNERTNLCYQSAIILETQFQALRRSVIHGACRRRRVRILLSGKPYMTFY